MYWSDYAETKILNTFRGETVVAPTTLYAAAFLSNPTDTGGGTEISYPGYARQTITFSVPADDTTGTYILNDADVNFPVANQAAGNVTYFGFFDSATGGNMWCYMKVEGDTLTVESGVAPLLKAGKLKFVSRGDFSKVMKARCVNLLRKVDLQGFTSHVALFDGNPENGGAELSGAGYGRFSVEFGTPEAQSSGQMKIGNSAAASSNAAESNWGTWRYTAIMDAVSNGYCVAFWEKESPQVMGETRAVTIQKPNDLTISIA